MADLRAEFPDMKGLSLQHLRKVRQVFLTYRRPGDQTKSNTPRPGMDRERFASRYVVALPSPEQPTITTVRQIMTKATDRFLYGQFLAEARSAAGAKGVLIRTAGGATVFRVYDGPERLTDYEIRHDDLSVTIDPGELAAFYKVGERHILDHGPQVLGLRKINER